MTTVSEFTIRPGERIPFVLTWFPSHEALPEAVDPELALAETEEYWLEWAGRAATRATITRRSTSRCSC